MVNQINFRGELVRKLTKIGCNVGTLASGAQKGDIEKVKALGASYEDYPLSRNGLNPRGDINTLLSLSKILNKKRPNVILAYTIKPIIWAGIASRFIPDCRFYALVTGLGFAFQTKQREYNYARFINGPKNWHYRFRLCRPSFSS